MSGTRERAARFLERHGGELERRAAAVLIGRAPARDLHAWLAERQLADGGFAAGPGSGAALSETRRVLGVLGDLRSLSGPLVERICRFLEAQQRHSGSWAEGEAALFETGLLAGLLAKTPCARTSALDRAADWLAQGFAPERVQGFAWSAIAGYAAAFANLPHDAGDEILQWCGRELERGFRAGRFDAVRTARVLTWCDASALPGARIDAADLVAAICSEQADDGGWLPSAAPAERALHGFDALAALTHLAGSRRGTA